MPTDRLRALPIERSVCYNQIDGVRLLMAAGADLHGKRFSPPNLLLIKAAQGLMLPIVALLLESGVDVHGLDAQGKNALDHTLGAMRYAFTSPRACALVMRALASAGLHRPALASSVFSIGDGAKTADFHEVLEVLIDNSAFDPCMPPPADMRSPPLYYSHSVAVLLRYGMDPNSPDVRNVAMNAFITPGTLLLLIVAGLDLDARHFDQSVRAIAAQQLPTVAWDAPRSVVRRQCADLFLSNPKWKPSLMRGLLPQKLL